MDGLATQAGMVRRGGFDADAAAYFAAIASAGSSISAANKTAVNAFVVGCKADGIWSAIKASCLLAGPDDLTGALVPLVGPAPTNNGFVSGDYSRTYGLVGDGTKYLASNLLSESLPQNNVSMFIWCQRLTTVDLRTYVGAGAGTSAGTTHMRRQTTNSIQFRSRSGGGASSPADPGTGFFGWSRNNSANFTWWSPGSSATSSIASTTPLSGDLQVFGGSGAGSTICDADLSLYIFGEAIDGNALKSRLTTYMAALT